MAFFVAWCWGVYHTESHRDHCEYHFTTSSLILAPQVLILLPWVSFDSWEIYLMLQVKFYCHMFNSTGTSFILSWLFFIMQLSYLYNGNSYPDKTAPLYWDCSLDNYQFKKKITQKWSESWEFFNYNLWKLNTLEMIYWHNTADKLLAIFLGY